MGFAHHSRTILCRACQTLAKVTIRNFFIAREEAPEEAIADPGHTADASKTHARNSDGAGEAAAADDDKATIREIKVEITVEAVQAEPMQIAVLEVVPRSLGQLEETGAAVGPHWNSTT